MLETVVGIAKTVGAEVLKVYGRKVAVAYKADNSPLTEADLLANALICDALNAAYPNIPILSEETKAAPYEERQGWKEYWCVDPIDGTKEFIKKTGDFTVNIALIRHGVPVLGVVQAPVWDVLYGAQEGKGAFKETAQGREALHVTPFDTRHCIVVASKSYLSSKTKRFIAALKAEVTEVEVQQRGSSLKLCLIAEGKAHLYPRIAPTMEWDTAAGHAILKEAGGEIYMYNPELTPSHYYLRQGVVPLTYNKPSLYNPSFIAV